jgi:alpha-D-xyloside xylohydrolase
VPWADGEDAVDVLRAFTRLRMRLMPYLAIAAEEAPTAAYLDRQHLLGPDVPGAPASITDGTATAELVAGAASAYDCVVTPGAAR